MKVVKSGKKGQLQEGISRGMYEELRELKREKEGLIKRSEEIVDEAMRVKRENEKTAAKGDEYDRIWERVGDVEDSIMRRETVAMSSGVREICFIERERERERDVPLNSETKLSKSDIQKDLKSAQRKYLEQMILPRIVETEDFGPLFHQYSVDFALLIKQGLKDSREPQRSLEARIRKSMKKFGDEKRYIVNTPVDEVVEGFPVLELKWMFGDKEVVVPKAIGLHLYHGWKKWREETKADRKKENTRRKIWVVSKTWYDEQKNRWEMDPIAVPYAVSKKLIDSARIRHDWGAMYVALKGDTKEYYVNIKGLGGFDGLYMKMLASGIPTSVQLMWIPFSELNFHQQFPLTTSLLHQCLRGLGWVVEKVKNINDDIVTVIFFPIVRVRLGMAWPEEIDQTAGSTRYLKWQSEAEMSFKSKKTDDLQWFLWFLIRSAVYGYILYNVFRILKRKVPRLLGYGPLRRDPNMQKFRRVSSFSIAYDVRLTESNVTFMSSQKSYIQYKVRKIKQQKKAGIDPIKTAFDGMNFITSFLQNPRTFQENGHPCTSRMFFSLEDIKCLYAFGTLHKGVLIVGERGTGKTSLALAIAAEARVPVVKVEAQQLEARLWVGQSASNVRELFQIARDLAPVIIFVEDFNRFAGVRGIFIHTKKQDHEAFINLLLVELDGYLFDFPIVWLKLLHFCHPDKHNCLCRFEKQDGVVLMATTRSLKHIDEALQPTQAEREKILQIAAKETMDDELIDLVDWRKMYDLAYYKAKEMLQKNCRVLEKIVDELLEFEILTGKLVD
ncbi:hypothetical protein ACJRO7_020171 [Eucalyptus globulus]|uniref:AAA+ ATPase domain-containing protein n=1 Tax=Eucalyptus globulus TaxID=34317 RepID=A0ABD3KLM8_EUCGL